MMQFIEKFSGKLRYLFRRITLHINRLRSSYRIQQRNGLLKIVVPERHRNKVRILKYFLTLLGLISAFFFFSSLLISFLFGLVIFLFSSFIEKIAFAHNYAFIHPLPNFDLDPDKWVGMGFGFAIPKGADYDIPLVSMMVTDLDYAKKIESLFLQWTNGAYEDKLKCVQTSVVVLNPEEYVFLFYPNTKRPAAKRFFQSARDTLKNVSLKDEIAEHHISLILGKRCKVSKGSYFHQFRKRFRQEVPVAFDFILPPFDRPKTTNIRFIFFDLSIKDKSELTRKDFAYNAIWLFERGGKCQGPKNY